MPLLFRLAALPSQLHILLQHQCRLASAAASSNAGNDSGPPRFPFPIHPRPTPYQIFHLPYNSSQKDIKARYYDLVRVHHPDSPHCRMLSPAERHSRFQAITSAYELLRGKTRFDTGWKQRSAASGGDPVWDPFEAELTRRRNAYYAHPTRQPGYAEDFQQQAAKDVWTSDSEHVWKDRIIILFGILSLIAGIVPGFIVFPAQWERRHKAAATNLKQARSDAREFGEVRMAEVRRRVQEIKSQTSS